MSRAAAVSRPPLRADPYASDTERVPVVRFRHDGRRDTWRSAAGPYLGPGEEIQAVIPAEASYPSPAPFATIIIILRRASRLVVATNQRVLIFRRTAMGALGELLGERPRDIRIGPPHSLFVFYGTNALGERLYIHRRWFRDVRAADAAIAPETTG